MKILVLANNDVGLFRFRIELLLRLLKQHEVYICLPDGGYIPQLVAIGCKFIACDFERHGTNPIKELKLISIYKKTVRALEPDVVLTYTIKPNVYGGIACASLGVPYLANITGLGTAIENAGMLQKITLRLYRYGLRKAQRVFFQNSANRDFMLQRGIVRGPHTLLPGSGVNLEKHCYEEYPEEDGTLTFLFIGRLMKDKGIEEFVSAAKVIREKHSSVRFVAIGRCEADYKEKLATLDADRHVELLGQQSDVHRFIKNAHAVVLPSYHEGMANVLLEGAASGRPVLASNVPGCRETFDEGVSGMGFEPRNVDSLCEAIETFLALPYDVKAEMGRAGRKKMEQEFDRNLVIEKYMEELQKIVEGR